MRASVCICGRDSCRWLRERPLALDAIERDSRCFSGRSSAVLRCSHDWLRRRNKQAYKACMRSKGWTRVQGTGSQYPDVPHFRGPEGDDEFKPADRAWFTTQGSPSGR